MQIAAYTLAMTSVYDHDPMFISGLLNEYFCPVFAAHGLVDTLAVCEDNKYTENNVVTFRHYDNFLQSSCINLVAVTIQEHGDVNDSVYMIAKIVNIMNETGGRVIVLSNYYNN